MPQNSHNRRFVHTAIAPHDEAFQPTRPNAGAVQSLSHVHLLIAGIDGCLAVDGLLCVHRLLASDWLQLVLLDDSITRDTLHAAGLLCYAVALEVDTEGNQSADEESPLKGAERSSGLGGIRWATVAAEVDVAVVVALAKAPCSCYGGEWCKGREPENTTEEFEGEMHEFVVDGWEPECGDLDVADEEESPDEGEYANAISSIEN